MVWLRDPEFKVGDKVHISPRSSYGTDLKSICGVVKYVKDHDPWYDGYATEYIYEVENEYGVRKWISESDLTKR